MTPDPTQPNNNSQIVNPYLDDPQLNYNLDKAKRSYEDLTLRYNIPEWDDLMKYPLPNDEVDIETGANEQMLSIEDNTDIVSNNFPFLEDSKIPQVQTPSSLGEGLMNTTLANLKTIQTPLDPEIISAHSNSPETSPITEYQKPAEYSRESKVENIVEKKQEITPKKEPDLKQKEDKNENANNKILSAAVISSMIGKFNVYGYAPSASVLNKLIRAKNPQTAWKVFPTTNAKSWLYALAGRLIAIHNSNGDFDK